MTKIKKKMVTKKKTTAQIANAAKAEIKELKTALVRLTAEAYNTEVEKAQLQNNLETSIKNSANINRDKVQLKYELEKAKYQLDIMYSTVENMLSNK